MPCNTHALTRREKLTKNCFFQHPSHRWIVDRDGQRIICRQRNAFCQPKPNFNLKLLKLMMISVQFIHWLSGLQPREKEVTKGPSSPSCKGVGNWVSQFLESLDTKTFKRSSSGNGYIDRIYHSTCEICYATTSRMCNFPRLTHQFKSSLFIQK